MMRTVIVFFNDEPPYTVDVGFHLNSIRLEYPNGMVSDLDISAVPVHNPAQHEEYYVAADRELENAEVLEAINRLL